MLVVTDFHHCARLSVDEVDLSLVQWVQGWAFIAQLACVEWAGVDCVLYVHLEGQACVGLYNKVCLRFLDNYRYVPVTLLCWSAPQLLCWNSLSHQVKICTLWSFCPQCSPMQLSRRNSALAPGKSCQNILRSSHVPQSSSGIRTSSSLWSC